MLALGSTTQRTLDHRYGSTVLNLMIREVHHAVASDCCQRAFLSVCFPTRATSMPALRPNAAIYLYNQFVLREHKVKAELTFWYELDLTLERDAKGLELEGQQVLKLTHMAELTTRT